ncbi:MAG: hypothetical protein ACP5UG_07095 [Thermoplasmata archaeon]
MNKMPVRDQMEGELPEKVREILKDLAEIENSIDENFPDDDWLWDYPFIHRRLIGPLVPIFEKEHGGEINVIPPRYGSRGNCRDKLLVFIEPSFWILQADEWHPEMRLRKRIESAINLVDRCKTRYVIFWASIWDFRLWRKYESKFSGQTVILRPWKMKYIILR